MSQNPCGLNGFAFLEFSSPDLPVLTRQFAQMGFSTTKTHQHEEIFLLEQGQVRFIINHASNCQASHHANTHGAGACAMGFQVQDVNKAFTYAIQHGAKEATNDPHLDHGLPSIEGIGGSVIYFVDEHHQPFANQWQEHNSVKQTSIGLETIDHLTHNVHRGNMSLWAEFYEDIFNFKEIRDFDIEGQMTGLLSRAMGSPCGKIKIPLNESKDDVSQIEEFLNEYRGEGIQHIALSTSNIIQTVDGLSQSGVPFLDVPDTYYEMIDTRIPWHKQPINELKKHKILIDGEKDPAKGLLLQIFTENIFGPVFFEIIERQGNQGFGEGNFRALFEAIERDQIRRGTLEVSS